MVTRTQNARGGLVVTGPGHAGSVPALACVRFSQVARLLAAAARAEGLEVPGFRSPPQVPGADRTIRRWPQGAVVSVRLRDRPFGDAVADMIEGVVAANRLAGARAERCRRRLREALGPEPAA